VRTLILMPCFNEENTLRRVLAEVKAYGGNSDILAIDDGSVDSTLQILTEFEGVGVLRHPRNQGYGSSLIDGFSYAASQRYEVCITIDCDEQHEPHLIPQFLQALSGWDVISGSRYLEAGSTQPPLERYQINMEITRILNQITGYQLTDSFCGFKAYRVKALAGLQLEESSYGFPIQFWLRAWKQGLKIKELPVGLIYKDYSRRFPGDLNDPVRRRQYYLQLIEEEIKKWQKS
jgi:glycosyltransferase involved in cell wall biosynthesis